MTTIHDAPPDGVPEDPGNSVDVKARPKHKNSAREELINRILSYILFVIATVNEYLTDVIPGQARRLMGAGRAETNTNADQVRGGAEPDGGAGGSTDDGEDEGAAETTVGAVKPAKDVEVDNDSAVDIPNEDFELDGIDAHQDARSEMDQHAAMDVSEDDSVEGLHDVNASVAPGAGVNDTAVALPGHAEAVEEDTAATGTHDAVDEATTLEVQDVEIKEGVALPNHVETATEDTAQAGTDDADTPEVVTLEVQEIEIKDHVEAEDTAAPGTHDTEIHEADTLEVKDVEIRDEAVALPEDHVEAIKESVAPETDDVEIHDEAVALPEDHVETIQEDIVASETDDVAVEVQDVEIHDEAVALPENHVEQIKDAVAPETDEVAVTLEAKDTEIQDEAVALPEHHVETFQEKAAPETDHVDTDAVALNVEEVEIVNPITPADAVETPEDGPLDSDKAVESHDENIPGTEASELTDVDFETKLSSHLASLGLSPFADNDYLGQVVENARKLKDASSLKTDDLYDLATLALYQPVTFCDDSTSMWDGSRIQDQIQLVTHMSSISTRLAPQGYGSSLQFLNHARELDSNLPAAEVARIISDVRPNGSTKLGTNLKSKILDPLVYDVLNKPDGRLSRPVLISCLIDGHPTGEAQDTLQRTISDCMDFLEQKGYRHTAVLYQISQIGNDEDAEVFLQELRGDAKLKEVLHCSTERLDEAYKLHESEEELERWLLKELLRPTKQE